MSLTPRPSGNFHDEAFEFIRGGEGFEPRVYGDSIFGLASLAASRLRIDFLASRWIRCERRTRRSRMGSASVGSPM